MKSKWEALRDQTTIGYLILSLASGFIELGIIIFAIKQQMPIIAIPLLGLSYQLGGLSNRVVRLPLSINVAIVVIAVILIWVSASALVPLLFAVFMVSVGLQGGREIMSEKFQLGTFVKRVSRVVGFALSGFFSLSLFIGLAGIVVTVLVVLRRQLDTADSLVIANKWKPTFIEFTMLVHQSHYFTYAYFIPFLFFQEHTIDLSLLGPLFVIGWISYSLTPIIFGKHPTMLTLVIGHFLASATLFIIFWFSHNFASVMLAWFFSGFGGGTVFCLTKLHRQEADNASDLDLWENVGHVTGLVMSLLIILIWGRLNYIFMAAGFIAFLTALLLPLRLFTTGRTASTE